MYALAAAAVLGLASMANAQTTSFPDGVIATGTMGVTNPTAAIMGTAINQSSDARLLTLNSIDDFCLFAPPSLSAIADSETIEVAWCTQPRNNARLIPDGTLTGVSFLKNDFYVQIMGYGNFTNLFIPVGDEGGELDPHGAFGSGNPIGGNVTTNVTGSDINVAEWMEYISADQFCIRACTNANETYSAAAMCWHELDEMGCFFVMPGNYDFNNTYESCEADVAYPPGWYPTATVNGEPEFSSFAQFFTGVYTDNGTPVAYTVGDLVTPTTVAFSPSSSNCVTQSTISNGLLAVATDGVTSSGTAQVTGTAKAGSSSSGKGSSASSTGSSSSDSDSSAALPQLIPGAGALVGMALASIFTIVGGAVVIL